MFLWDIWNNNYRKFINLIDLKNIQEVGEERSLDQEVEKEEVDHPENTIGN